MREFDLRRVMQSTALAAALVIGSAAAPVRLSAQTADNNTPVTTTETDADDDGMDLGWLGLLGLAGLLGLRRRDHTHTTTTYRADPADTTTRRL